MFPTFISILDIQSWWEVPSIAHFCSLFRTAFNLLDFDIEDLEEALLTDGTEESSWLQELIVRLLSGCLPQNEISTFNYQMFLRRLFRQKCQEHDRYNPFNTDIDFQLLPLRTKVDILHALCDFRLDADDVLDQLKNLDADSLRVEPLGYDSNNSAYWYFYGTRLYREDFQTKNNKKKSIWQVICFTEDDWLQLTKKFKKSTSKVEKLLFQALNENFLPELPRLFKEKERLARKRLLENQPRRTSSRIRKLEEEEVAKQEVDQKDDSSASKKADVEEKEPTEEEKKRDLEKKRREAYERRSKLKEGSDELLPESSSEKGDKSEVEDRYEMAGAKARDKKTRGRQRKVSTGSQSSKDEYAPKAAKKPKKSSDRKSSRKTPPKLATVGRQTNNSLSAATGQIVIHQEAAVATKKKLKPSQVFRQTDEDLQTGMHKILDFVKNHEDAWPFADPVDEEYAPNYYSIIRKPMDLQTMEERLDSGHYKCYTSFRADFQLIVDNCRLYNGAENEYTEMVDNLLKVFDRATEKFLDQISSSDDEVAVRYLNNDGTPSKKKKKAANNRKSGSVDKKRDKSEESIKNDLDDIDDVPVNKKKGKPNKSDLKNNNRKTDKKSTEKSSKSEKVSKKVAEKSAKKTQEKVVKKDKKKNKHKKEVELDIRSNASTPPPPSDIESDAKSDITPSWSPSPDRFNFSPKKGKKRKASFSDNEEESIKPKKSKLKDKEIKPEKNRKGDKSTKNVKSEKPNKISDKVEKNEKAGKLGKSEKPAKTEKISKVDGKTDKVKSDKIEKNRPLENSKKHKFFKEKTKFDDLDDLDRFSPPPPPFSPKPKDKHNKLRETIEKLKAKSLSTKLKDPFDFKVDDPLKENKKRDKPEPIDKKASKLKTSQRISDTELDGAEIASSNDQKRSKKQKPKQNVATIEALTLATEQTLKDINKWLDDTPKMPEFSSASNSPAYGILEEFDSPGNSSNNAVKVDVVKKDKKKEKDVSAVKKKKDSTKLFKRREVQRTIDRLQPGKSKGNLIATVSAKSEEQFPCPLVKKDSKNSLIVKTDTNAPKLSLGSVLDSFGKHKFVDEKKEEPAESQPVEPKVTQEEEPKESKEKKEEKPEKEKEEEGGATPNLSAWFKAFGAPKVPQKRDPKEADDKEKKVAPPEPSPSLDSPQAQPTPRQRKISTGSSMSERSSFSQDMDSPRVGIDERGAYPAPYPSPLHRSPSGASPVMNSPRPDVSPKAAAYPTFNGQMRVGFYQDTVSNKSSPDKSSCSPRDNPQSPYGQYSEHVYTPNQGQYPPYYGQYQYGEYYDTNKSLTDQYQAKAGQNYQQQQQQNSPQSQVNSPAASPASCHDVPQPHAPSQPQNPQSIQQQPNLQQPSPAPQPQPQQQQSSYSEEVKSDKMMFPVKKRAYNELEMPRYDTPQQPAPIQKEPYIQNIPDPKPLTIQTPENYNNGPSSLSPVQNYHNKQPYKNNSISPVPPAPQNHYPAPNSPAPIYNPYNEPSYTNLSASRNPEAGKLEMSKYTNMGYSGHDMSYPPRPAALPQRHDYPSTSQLPPASHASQDSSLRYTNLNTVQEMNYKLPNEPMHNYQQRQEALPPSTSSNYKDIIPRTYQTMEQQPGLRNLSHIVDRRGYENEVLQSNYYQQEKALNSHLFNKSMPPTSSAALPMFSQANVAGLAPPPSYNQSMQSSSTAVAAAMYSHRQMEMQNMPPVSGANNMPSAEQKPAPPVVEKKKKGRKSKAEKAAAAAAAAAALQQQQQQQQPPPDNSQQQQQQQSQPPPNSSNITNQGFQSYAGLKATSASATTSEPSAISLKTSSVVPGSAFNFGPTPSGIGISPSIYSSDKDAYPNFLDDFRSAPNYYMRDKQSSRVPAHQASAQSSSYAFLGAPQPRPSYPPIGGPFIPPPGQPPHVMDTSSSIYQHYIQAGVLNQGLLGPPGAYPPGYHPLSMRQPPYDSMPRPWL